MVTADRLKEVLRYDPDTGWFFWVKSLNPRGPVGARAGFVRKSDHRSIIRIDRERYYASRLAWLYMTGVFPADEIDHRDGNPGNDRWNNLRQATDSQQNANRRRMSHYLKGATYHKKGRKFRAQITVNGRYIHLGLFDTAEAAHAAYVKAASTHFGEFARAE